MYAGRCMNIKMGSIYTINVKGRLLSLERPLVMGILNVTPDSFYSGSRIDSAETLVGRARIMLDAGADILDVGGCSTRPSGKFVDEAEELRRLHSALDALDAEFPDAVVSVDTFRARVADECVSNHNVAIVNDVSGFDWDSAMLDTVARLNVPYVLTHSVGVPGDTPRYADFLPDVLSALSRKMWKLRERGINDIIVDPGFGFGKSLSENYRMMAHLRDFAMLDAPLLIGVSRKSMITKLLGCSALDALNGTTVLNTMALVGGAAILRVHDVAPAVEAVKIYSATTAEW